MISHIRNSKPIKKLPHGYKDNLVFPKESYKLVSTSFHRTPYMHFQRHDCCQVHCSTMMLEEVSLLSHIQQFHLSIEHLYLRVLSSPWCVVAIVNKLPDSAKDSSNDIPSAAPSRGFVPAPTYKMKNTHYALYEGKCPVVPCIISLVHSNKIAVSLEEQMNNCWSPSTYFI